MREGRLWALALAVALGSAALLVGCSCDPLRRARAELLPVPAPSGLEQMDRAVEEDYGRRRAVLDAVLARREAGPAEAGEAFGELGMWYHAYRLLDGAAGCYTNARRLEPDAVRWAFYLGKLAAEKGQSEIARAALEDVLRLAPRQLAALVELGDLELKLGEPEAARQLFERALEVRPGGARALAGLAKLSLDGSGDAKTAVELLLEALERQPRATALHQSLGLAYRALGDMENARRYLEAAEVTQRDRVPLIVPDPLTRQLASMRLDARVHVHRGMAAMKSGRVDDAVGELRQAVAADPDRLESRLNLAVALRLADQPEAALAELGEVLRRSPGHAGAEQQSAVAEERLGDLAAAEKHYRAALEADPDSADGHLRLAHLLQVRGELREGLEHATRAVALDPLNARARFVRATALIRLERFSEARQVLQDAIAVFPARLELRRLLERLDARALVGPGED